MSISGQGHSLTLVKGHSDFKVKCLNFGLYTQVSDSGPLGPLVVFCAGGRGRWLEDMNMRTTIFLNTTSFFTEPYSLMKIILMVFKIEGIVVLTIKGR